jgi:hypothetical protein
MRATRSWLDRVLGRHVQLTQEELDFIYGRDEEENIASTPPDNENIEIHSVWLAECYPPSMIDSLITSLRGLGWCDSTSARFTHRDTADKWIQQYHGSPTGGAWLNLGLIASKSSSMHGVDHWAELPDVVDHLLLEIHIPLPGLVVLLFHFIMTGVPSERLQDALHRKFKSTVTFFRRGWSATGAVTAKREAVEATREAVIDTCRTWISNSLPGVFASSHRSDVFPSCDFMTLEAGDPIKQGFRGHWDSYLSILRLSSDTHSWIGQGLRNLILIQRDITILASSSLQRFSRLLIPWSVAAV